jgi:hypothetical protein
MSVFTAIALFSVLITGTEANPVRLSSSFSFGDILGIAFLAHVSVRARLLLFFQIKVEVRHLFVLNQLGRSFCRPELRMSNLNSVFTERIRSSRWLINSTSLGKPTAATTTSDSSFGDKRSGKKI